MSVAHSDQTSGASEPRPEAAATGTVTLAVAGMTCAACAARLEKGLSAVPGVARASVNFALGRADVAYDPARVSTGGLAAAVVRAGFEVEGGRAVTLDVGGMTCAACAARIEAALAAVPGVLEAQVNLALERADVRVADDGAPVSRLVEAVERAGYRATARRADGAMLAQEVAHEEERRREERRSLWLFAFAAALTAPLLLAMAAPWLGSPWRLSPMAQALLATPVQLVAGARFYRGAWRALKAGSGNMDVLVALGTTVAWGYSLWRTLTAGDAAGHLYFEASSVVLTMVLLGKLLEARARRSASQALRSLMRLRPQRARVERDGGVEEVGVEEVRTGDVVVASPGERIAVDGVVLDGWSETDDSLVTGESLPAQKRPGDKVIAGSVNGSGRLRIEATAVGEDSTLARIVRMVENAQVGKAPVQRLVDRVSAVFVPIVVALAAITAAGWLLAGGGVETALTAAISVLVIACPCALGLATPAALVAGTGAAARAGVLIRDIETIERARRIDAVVLDKTGTLTMGQAAVADFVAYGGFDPARALATAAAVQSGSEHPLARALVAHAEAAGLSWTPAVVVRAQPGMGVEGEVAGAQVAIGNRALMERAGVAIDSAEADVAAAERSGRTPALIAVDGRLAAVASFTDPLRPTAGEAVAALRARGVRVVMASGDALAVARVAAAELGIDDVRAPVRPDEKAAIAVGLRAEGRRVAMVGDGVNDAPALAAADVGVAVGSGTDVAMETAGVTLMRPDPRLIAAALDIAAATWRKIWQNLFWAFAYNVVGLPIAAFGLLDPALAGAAMAASSVSVVGNALLLRRWRPRLETVGSEPRRAD